MENDPNSPTEEWSDIVERVITAADKQLHVGFTKEEEAILRDHMLNLRGTVAGRFLWQLGTKTVDTLGLASLQNCAACVIDEPIKPFVWAMDMLMLGSGVGYNIQREYVYKLPKVREAFNPPTRMDEESSDFIVPDTRQGWVELLRKTLEAAFNAEAPSTFTFSTQLIRSAGAPIVGFGGVASGPEPLCTGIQNIGLVLESRKGKQLRPIDCLDIMNIIGSIVVSGNVRRSAQIAIGDMDDFQYLRSKRWDLGNIPNWRAFSNNSVVCNKFADLPDEIWKGYTGNGEPFGLINLGLSRKIGRTGETKYKDKDVVAYNPCLHPDTLVSTTEGRVRIADMTRPYMVYSMDDDGSLVVRKSSPSWISKRNAPTVRVGLSSGNVLTCTPDHKVYSATRGWIEASSLQQHERVVHLARARRGAAYAGVRLTSQSPSEQRMEHRVVWEAHNGPIPANYDIHHKDGDTFNNHIDNLECLSHSEHSTVTRNECQNNHQVWGADGDFVSTNSGYVKPIKNVPPHLQTGLLRQPTVTFVEEGPTSDVYDISVEGTHNFVADYIIVHNCAEQSLADNETCCLAEVFLPNVRSYEELLSVVNPLYRINKHSLALSCHNKETEVIVHKNMRMGIGITGYLQATEEQRTWLPKAYEYLRDLDEKYSKAHGWPTSIKLTTIKPSGTLSLLPGVTPGCHPAFAQYMIRRIRIASNSPLVDVIRDHGYPVEYVRHFDGQPDYSTVVAEFPMAVPEGTPLAEQMSAIDQLEVVRRLQSEWSDNSVSCTVYYTRDELPAIREYLAKHYDRNFKTLSFLPREDHGFDQAPLEAITKEEYDKRVRKSKPIESFTFQLEFDPNDPSCASGACPVR